MKLKVILETKYTDDDVEHTVHVPFCETVDLSSILQCMRVLTTMLTPPQEGDRLTASEILARRGEAGPLPYALNQQYQNALAEQRAKGSALGNLFGGLFP